MRNPVKYPVLPLRDIVVFPNMVVPLFVGRDKSVRALENVMENDKKILLVAQKDAGDNDPAPEDIYDVGVVASVLQLLKLPDGTVKVLVEGERRTRIIEYTHTDEYFEATAEDPETVSSSDADVEALMRSVVTQFESYVKLNKRVPPEVIVSVGQIDDPGQLGDTVASHLNIKISEKQDLLEIISVAERLERVYALMEGEMSVLQVEKKIRNRVKRQMEKTQREYYLNE
ncbi:MAG: LON peptidase substrate-binding domain-containing protein, partial [Pseudomonadota bacterium]